MPEWLATSLTIVLITFLYLVSGLCVAVVVSLNDKRMKTERDVNDHEPPFGWGIFFIWPLVIIYYVLLLVWLVLSKSGETFWRLVTNDF